MKEREEKKEKEREDKEEREKNNEEREKDNGLDLEGVLCEYVT